MSAAVVSFIGCPADSMLASVRIARYLAAQLNLPLLDSDVKLKFNSKPETVFLVNGRINFCDYRRRLYQLVQTAQRYVWIQNDYSIECRRELRRPDMQWWTTIPDKLKKFQGEYVNWNALAYVPLERRQPRARGLFYWGAFREGRLKSFKKYLGDGTPYDVHISAPREAAKRFGELNGDASIYRPFGSLRPIQDFPATIYIEDDWSNKTYCSPANRFYEALSAGIAILFDVATAGTMANAGYDVKAWTVRDKFEVAALLHQADSIAEEQRRLWSKDYRKALNDRVNEVASEILDGKK